MTYIVTLVDFHGARPDVTDAAEAHFRSALDEALGDQVNRCLHAFVNAQEVGVGHLTREEIIDAAQWLDAFEKATIAGFRGLGDADEAYFEVRPT